MPENITQNNPLVYVVILNWNNAEDTLACLESLQASDYNPFIPVVVDNGSSDGSVEKIRAAFPEVKRIELTSNLGYAEGNNAGIRLAMNSNADYVMILNNDTLVEPEMLAELVALAESNQQIGMIGPMMYCFQPSDTIFALGSFVDWHRGETINRGMFQPSKNLEGNLKAEKVDFITGCGVLVSRKLLEEVGALDPIYYLNFEDADWGVRAQRQGFEIWYTPKAILWHKVSATLGQASPKNTYYMTRNALLFFWRNAPPGYRWQALTRIILRTLRTISAWTFKPEYWNESFRKLRQANLLALRDFSLGNFGKMEG
ncbi:MAG: glycosyltransferase family 2 protein [Anaerolineales bacterium]|jgi:GT2 family glycosyltransferase